MLKRTILIENPCHLNVTNDLFQITYKFSNPPVETGLRPVSTTTTNPPVKTGLRPVSTTTTNPTVETGLRPVSTTTNPIPETGLRPVSTSSSTNPPVKTGLRPVSTSDSTTMPFDEIGYIIIENIQTTATLHFFQKCAENNVVIAFCDKSHTPVSLATPLYSHTTQTQTLNNQLELTDTLKNNLWKQLISSKISNQARLLKKLNKDYLQLEKIAKKLTIQNTNTSEATASRFYWSHIFDKSKFVRDPDGDPPNNLLNYGYAILRAATVRALISSGLLPQISFKHHNKYDPLPLADDVMEPYRAYVDEIVYELFNERDYYILHHENKEKLLKVLVCDTKIGTVKRPLMIALTYTTASIAKVVNKKSNYLALPKME